MTNELPIINISFHKLLEDIWVDIVNFFLKENEVAQFNQVCKSFNIIGSKKEVLKTFYNRLYAIDKTLPKTLPPSKF